MNLSQYFGEAFSVLLANRVRSILTILGLIIGVTAVIAIQVLGAGMAGAVSGLLGGISDRTFIVVPNQQQADFTRAAIRLTDLRRAKDEVPNVIDAIPAAGQRLVASYGHAHRRVTAGAGPDERFATSTPIRYGRKFDQDDIALARAVCVISDAGYRKLGMTGDPTGGSVRIGDRRYTIVGVLGSDKSGVLPLNFNLDVTIAYPAYERDFVRGHALLFVRFLMNDASQVEQTEADALSWLRHLKGGRVEYQTFDRKSFGKAVDAIFTGITVVVALIGAVSLLVAGIGILNIMLVSVAERTREIGLRKAIGATRFQVLLQFFIEALALSGFGCLVGLILGVAIGALVNDLAIVKFSGVVAPIPWVRSILIATIFTTVVTLAFGTYPAWRAATLDPIEALRYE
ncbi:MAG TPA: ABC transporter permease [Candidatus Elarobacter sp.]|jgi:ABC-type antimicrobial peptide transport system permease subunit|nr:ABC transporter permease [Candidatus Elarobacter sp.]